MVNRRYGFEWIFFMVKKQLHEQKKTAASREALPKNDELTARYKTLDTAAERIFGFVRGATSEQIRMDL